MGSPLHLMPRVEDVVVDQVDEPETGLRGVPARVSSKRWHVPRRQQGGQNDGRPSS